jgi:hypothetical protein
MALLKDDIDHNTIHMMGRWYSDAMMLPPHKALHEPVHRHNVQPWSVIVPPH